MKSLRFLALLVGVLLLLTACGEPESASLEKEGEKVLTFIDKVDIQDTKLLVFESIEDTTYYGVVVNSWQKKNYDVEYNTEITFDRSTGTKIDGLSDTLFRAVYQNVGATNEYIYIYDEWKRLFELEDYTEKKE